MKGKLLVISGPSGAGKGTICDILKKDSSFGLSISMTTRAPRGKEVDGVSYYFVTHEQFEQAIKEGKLLEYAKKYENYYGTPLEPVLKMLAAGKNVILEIEMQGAAQAKRVYSDAILVYILPPNQETLRTRLLHRGTDSEEQITIRQSEVLEELEKIREYDYYVVNDVLEDAVQVVRNIIADKADDNKVANHADEIINKFKGVS